MAEPPVVRVTPLTDAVVRVAPAAIATAVPLPEMVYSPRTPALSYKIRVVVPEVMVVVPTVSPPPAPVKVIVSVAASVVIVMPEPTRVRVSAAESATTSDVLKQQLF